MRMYSVSEAIGPAWERTQTLLRTGRWGTNIKMAFVLILAELGTLLILPVQNLLPSRLVHAHADASPLAPTVGAASAGLNIFFALLFTAVYVALFYFGSRMQLTLIDLILTRTYKVAPLWARNRQSVWRWTGLKLVPSALLLAGMVPWLLMVLRMQAGMVMTPGTPVQMQLGMLRHSFATLLSSSLLYLLLVGPALLLYSHWRDFVLPYLAVDQLSVRDACARWLLLWRTFPGAMLGYVFFRLLLLIAVGVVLYLSTIIVLAIPLVLAVLLGVGIHLLVHGTAGTAFVVLVGLVAGLLWLAWANAVWLFGSAAFAGFFQCYALYFLGGRDPRIGALLEPETSVPVFTPPPFVPDDAGDEDDGPTFPADPALA